MIKTLCSLLFCGVAVANTQVDVSVHRVLDGDTFEIIVPEHPIELQKIHIRVYGIDTPETSTRLAKCAKERALGNKAKEEVKKLIEHQTVSVTIIGHDKYGGRILGEVMFGTINLKQYLLDNGYAMPYNGQGQKHNWC